MLFFPCINKIYALLIDKYEPETPVCKKWETEIGIAFREQD